jgi:ABC-type dipeptide/oligopeptide/nickel transport system ATPase component
LPSNDDEFLRKYPSQMSVGQAQRVLIAMAVMHRPALLIADEATSALDVITQSEILALFRELNRSFGMAILYISHDLASVAGICDRIAILHQGQIVECGTTEQSLRASSTRIHAAVDGCATANPADKRAAPSENRSSHGEVATAIGSPGCKTDCV